MDTVETEPVVVPLLRHESGLLSPMLRKLIVVCAISSVIASFSGFGVALAALLSSTSATHAATHASLAATRSARTAAGVAGDIRKLLLNGKTASAIAAKKGAHEIQLLLAQQRYDHHQTVIAERQAANGEKTIQLIELQIEGRIDRHLDTTIRSVIAQTVAAESRHGKAQLRAVVRDIEGNFDTKIQAAVQKAVKQVEKRFGGSK
jgi:hypothetical protein